MGKGRTTMSGKISIVVVKGTVGYVAVGLEHYIAAQGKSPREAMVNFGKMLIAELVFCVENGLEALEGIDKAPQKYWDLHESAVWIKDDFVPREELIPTDDVSMVDQLIKAFELPRLKDFGQVFDCRLVA